MISIIMPAYNAEKTINNSIKSIVNQTYQDWELLIINDGSVDRTREIIESWTKVDNRIKVFNISNSGPSFARTLGIDNADGEYIAFCDSDDEMDSRMLEVMLLEMKADIDLVACSFKGRSKTEQDFVKNNFSKQEAISKVINSKEFGGYLWNKLFKKRIITDNNLKFDKDIFCCEDLLFVIQYAVNINRAAFVPEYLYYYNDNPISLTSGNFSWKKISNIIARKKVAELLVREGNKDNRMLSQKTLLEQTVYAYRQIKQYMQDNNLQDYDNEEYSKYCTLITEICREYCLSNIFSLDTTFKVKLDIIRLAVHII